MAFLYFRIKIFGETIERNMISIKPYESISSIIQNAKNSELYIYFLKKCLKSLLKNMDFFIFHISIKLILQIYAIISNKQRNLQINKNNILKKIKYSYKYLFYKRFSKIFLKTSNISLFSL